jgi:hypothetical protein
MAKFRKVREEAGIKHNFVTVKVPVVPDLETYDTHMVMNESMMRAEPVSIARAVLKKRKRTNKLYTLTSTVSRQPDSSGRLRSIVAAMLNSYMSVMQTEQFCALAYYRRSNPQMVLQHSKNTQKLSDELPRIPFIRNELLQDVTEGEYQRESDAEDRLDQNVVGFVHRAMRGALSLTSWFNDTSGPITKRVRFSQPIETAAFLPGGIELAPHSQLPEAPSDIEERYTRHFHKLCDVFGVGIALFGVSKRNGTISEVTESDLQLLRHTLDDLRFDVEAACKELIRLMDFGQHITAVKLKPHTFTNINALKELLEAECLDSKEFDRAVQRATGLEITTKNPPPKPPPASGGSKAKTGAKRKRSD